MSQIDLNKAPTGHKYKVSVDPEESIAERNVRLGKEVALFLFAIIVVGVLLYLCIQTMLSATASADDKRWAMSLLTGACGGIIGYLIKK